MALPLGRMTPHSAVFLALNCLYCVPVIGAFLFGYSEGGAGAAADLEVGTLAKMCLTYVVGVAAFLLGSRMGSKRPSEATGRLHFRLLHLFDLSPSFWLVCAVIVVALLISKVLLVPMGVYSQYAFDTGSMTGGLWSFSMFCSEVLALLSIAALFSTARHNVLWFAVLSGIDAINLLHGTRIFFLVGGVAFCFYAYVRRKLTWRIGITAAASALAIGYSIFLMRSDLAVDSESFSMVRLISPVMYESIFSQLSLFEVIRSPHLWDSFGSPRNFFLDAVYFLVPRILLPGKDQMLFIDRFADLSPLGAFSGYAQGLIYFGLLFPVFYLALGRISSWLFRKAAKSSLWSVIYIYVVCDILLRVMRDGYIIPIKALIDGLAILGIIRLFDHDIIHLNPDTSSFGPDVTGDHGGDKGAVNG